MEIHRRLNGHDLQSTDLYVATAAQGESLAIVKRPRIGVAYAGAWARRLLRFYIKGNACVSKA
jgi:DNA-3-methyladenine glycosylase